MTISNLKELDKLIQLCQKRGVTSINIDGIALILAPKTTFMKHSTAPKVLPDYSSDIPEANLKIPHFTGEITAPDDPDTEELTQEQILFYSSATTEAQ